MKRAPIDSFEDVFAESLEVRHAFAFWNGRAALHALLKALNIGFNDEVIVPAYTCWSAVAPIVEVGAKPIYVDVAPDTLSIDTGFVRGNVTPNTRAVIVQHTFGRRNDVNEIRQAVGVRDLVMIEDAAHCLGKDQNVKSQEEDILPSYWSFGWGKAMVLGGGGMATTSNAELAHSLAVLQSSAPKPPLLAELKRAFYKKTLDFPVSPGLRLAWTRISSAMSRSVRSDGDRHLVSAIIRKDVGLQRMGGLQAKSGLSAVSGIEGHIAHRRNMAELYNQLFRDRGWPVPAFTSTAEPLMLYPVRIRNRAELLRIARSRGLNITPWWTGPLHVPRAAAAALDYPFNECPQAQAAYREIIRLPTNLRVTEHEARHLVDFVCEKGIPAPAVA